jgi:membrane protein required for beta-lactamase induction
MFLSWFTVLIMSVLLVAAVALVVSIPGVEAGVFIAMIFIAWVSSCISANDATNAYVDILEAGGAGDAGGAEGGEGA